MCVCACGHMTQMEGLIEIHTPIQNWQMSRTFLDALFLSDISKRLVCKYPGFNIDLCPVLWVNSCSNTTPLDYFNIEKEGEESQPFFSFLFSSCGRFCVAHVQSVVGTVYVSCHQGISTSPSDVPIPCEGCVDFWASASPEVQ